jgi:hypothetical protein
LSLPSSPTRATVAGSVGALKVARRRT